MRTKSASSEVSIMSFALFSGTLCLLVATSALAEETARPCRDDAARLCQGVQPGEGRIAQCLKQHANELSPACKNNIAKMKEEIKEAKEACKGDAKKLCEGIKPGGGKIAQCLKQHESELSPACKAQMEKPRGRK